MDTVFAAGKYVTWGVVSVSVTNLAIVLLMVGVFALALLLPFPHGEESPTAPPEDPHGGGSQS